MPRLKGSQKKAMYEGILPSSPHQILQQPRLLLVGSKYFHTCMRASTRLLGDIF